MKVDVKLFKPKHAIIFGEAPFDVSIHIFLQAFIHEDELIETTIRLDGVELPSTQLKDLVNTSFSFEEGEIDGSMYLDNVHCPVDVSDFKFNLSRNGELNILLKGKFDFESVGIECDSKTDFVVNTQLSSCTVSEN